MNATFETVTSADGTVIAFDRYGDGPPVIIAAGAGPAALAFRSCRSRPGAVDCLSACLILPLDGELPIHEDDAVSHHGIVGFLVA